MQLGFIGVGNMGNPMAGNLQKAGHRLCVHDLRRESATNLEASGAQWANNAQEAATRADVVFLSLPMPADVERAVLAETGVLAGMASGSTIIDMSTNAPAVVQRLAAQTKANGVTFLDAPVSGGVRGARNATLAIMVGGDRAVYEKHESLLKVIGANVFYVGESGAGNVAKLINNMLAFINMMGTAEALVLGAKAGVDPNILWQVVKASSGNSFVWESGARAIMRDRLAPTFTVDLASKDIGLVTSLAQELGVPLAIGEVTETLIRRYQATGYAKEDVLATVKELEKQVNTTVRGTWRET
jgi:2-hydroxymethylglutarate dehydrogenase